MVDLALAKQLLVEAALNHLTPDTVCRVQDSYYKNNDNLSFEERCQLNYDHPNAIDYNLFISQIKQLQEGKSVQAPVYSYSEHLRTDQFISITPKPVILVEGY